MMGGRIMDDDGFTYVYGKAKAGRKPHKRNHNVTERCIRHDKRKVKMAELAEVRQELEKSE